MSEAKKGKLFLIGILLGLLLVILMSCATAPSESSDPGFIGGLATQSAENETKTGLYTERFTGGYRVVDTKYNKLCYTVYGGGIQCFDLEK